MQVWKVLHAARWKYRTQKIAKNSPSAHHRTTLSGYILATKAYISTIGKNLLSSNIFSRCPHNMVNFGPLAAEMGPVVWGTQQISTGFASWQRYCTALQQWASAKLCGFEQRAPPIFDRAAITLGNDPHSSYYVTTSHVICKFDYVHDGQYPTAWLPVYNNIQMMHGCKWNIQICCPEVDMSSRGRSPSDDISTEGQHIWMFHLEPCIICFVVWPTTSKYKIQRPYAWHGLKH